MPSQLVHIRSIIFDVLAQSQTTLRAALSSHDLMLEYVFGNLSPYPIGVFYIAVDQHKYRLGHRHLGRRYRTVVALCREDTAIQVVPKILPAPQALKILDRVEAALADLSAMSNHDILELSKAFNAARAAEPVLPAAFPPAPTVRPVLTHRQARLTYAAYCVERAARSPLTALDRKLESYRPLLEAADVDQSLLALSCQVRLAREITFQDPEMQQDAKVSLRDDAAHPDLESAIQFVEHEGYMLTTHLGHFDPYTSDRAWRVSEAGLASIAQDLINPARAWMPYRRPDAVRPSEVAIPSRIPVRFLDKALSIWEADTDPRCWRNLHPLIAAAVAHFEFVKIRPYIEGNGRVARFLFMASLVMRDFPLLAWHPVFELRRKDYNSALQASLRENRPEAFISFIIDACDTAIAISRSMIDVIVAERDRLTLALIAESVDVEGAREIAEELVGALMVESVHTRPDGRSARPLLSRLSNVDALQRLRTPFGAVFSVPAIRRLMADIRHGAG